MKYFELAKDEEKILEDFEEGKLVRAVDLDGKKKLYRKYAQNTLNKARNINIQLSERDLQRLKVRAVKEGISYQTLISSIIHRFTND